MKPKILNLVFIFKNPVNILPEAIGGMKKNHNINIISDTAKNFSLEQNGK
jgi:hypothetical protein